MGQKLKHKYDKVAVIHMFYTIFVRYINYTKIDDSCKTIMPVSVFIQILYNISIALFLA